MAYNCSNIFQNPGIKNSPEKGRYSDPSIPGMGSPYNKKGCKSSNRQTASQIDAFGPDSKLAAKEPVKAANILDGIKSSNPQVIKNPLGRGINTLNSQNNQKPMGKEKDCGCPKDLDNCNCE